MKLGLFMSVHSILPYSHGFAQLWFSPLTTECTNRRGQYFKYFPCIFFQREYKIQKKSSLILSTIEQNTDGFQISSVVKQNMLDDDYYCFFLLS